MVSISLAQVKLWGKLVGALAHDANSGYCTFEYAPQWLATGIEVSPIHLPLSRQKFTFRALPQPTYKGLPSAFADTLPDDFGNAIIDAWLAREGRDKNTFSALERLLYTGKRGMGALEYAPAIKAETTTSSAVELNALVQMAQDVLDNRSDLIANLADDKKQALSTMVQVGTSAGGARPKAVIGVNADRTQLRSGQVDLPKGFEHYLLKFDGVVQHRMNTETFGDPQGFGRMEFAYYNMAKAAGIDISHSELLEEGDRAHFMTKRFDRIGNRKVHYQSLCAMDHADFKKPGEYSYEQVFTVMRMLGLKRAEALAMFRRMVFNIVARNHDDHSKNFGFMLNDAHQWQLAPAFDIAYSCKKGSPWVHSHQLSINGKRDNFERNDLLVVASTFKKEANLIIDEVIEVVSKWQVFADNTCVFKDFSQQIQQNLRLNL